MYLVAIGGVIGSLFRYLLNEILGSDATGVMIANLIGVAVAGAAMVYFKNRPNEQVKNLLVPGFCGGLTTFSSAMLLSDKYGYAYLFETVALSFLVISFVVPTMQNRFGKKE